VAQSEHQFQSHPIEDQNQCAVNSKEDARACSNLGKVAEEPRLESQLERSNSDTRTKTAHFSHYECSDEVMMISNQVLPLKTVEKGKKAKDVMLVNEEESAQEPPGFESRVNARSYHTFKPLANDNEGLHTKGQEVDPIEPRGFEERENGIKDKKAEQISKSGPVNDGQGTQYSQSNANLEARNDTSSMDSCEKLAKEALQIGQILGIKVVRNEKAAIDRLTESMGRKKGVQTRSSKKALKNQGNNQGNTQRQELGMKIATWNIRGLGSDEKKWTMKKLIKDENIDLLGLVETKHADISLWSMQKLWGNQNVDWVHSPAENGSGRVLVSWHKESFEVASSLLTQRGICVFRKFKIRWIYMCYMCSVCPKQPKS